MAETNQRPLDHLRWQQRVIVVMAEAPDDPALLEQQRRLREAAPDLAVRDVTLITATNETVTIDGNRAAGRPSADQLRHAYARGASGFQVVLIGKDGGVKLRAGEPVPTADVLALIDSMPMRQREMREGASQPGLDRAR
jgi:hypothetical protein